MAKSGPSIRTAHKYRNPTADRDRQQIHADLRERRGRAVLGVGITVVVMLLANLLQRHTSRNRVQTVTTGS